MRSELTYLHFNQPYCIVLQGSTKYLSVLFGLSWRGNYRPLPPRMKMLFCWYPKGYKSLVAIYHSFYRDSRLEVKIVSSSIYARLKRRGFGREMIVFCFSVTCSNIRLQFWKFNVSKVETKSTLYEMINWKSNLGFHEYLKYFVNLEPFCETFQKA